MQSLLTDTLLPTTAPASNDAHAAARRDADAARDRDTAQPADKPVSIRVILSDDALERAAKARKAAFQMAATDAAQSRHDLARARVAQIKQRIDTLKKMLMFLGKAAAKVILRELRQLAGELGQAANALKESGGVLAVGASPGAAATPVVHDASGAPATGGADGAPAVSPAETAEGADATEAGASTPTATASRALAAYAAASDTAPDSDADASDTPAADTAAQGAAAAARADAAKTTSASVDTDTAGHQDDKASAATEARLDPQAAQKRREDDALAVRDAIRAMKELLAMLKSKLRQDDKEAQKQVAEVRDALAEAEKTAQAIDGGGGAASGVGGMAGGDAAAAAT